MLTKPQSTYRTTLTGAAGVSVANIQTLEDKTTLTKQNRRLAGIDFQLRLTTSAAAFTTTHTGLMGLIRRIRLYVNDGVVKNTARPCIDVSGPELWNLLKFCEVLPDRYSGQGVVYDPAGLTVATAYVIHFFLPCFDPELGEKAIPFQSIPMYKLNETAVLQVDLGLASDIGATGGVTGNVFLDWKPRFRVEEIERPYIPWELLTDRQTWAKTGENTYDFKQSGFITKFVMSNMTAATARGGIFNGVQRLLLMAGQTQVDEFTEQWQIACTDRSAPAAPQGTTFALAPTPALAYRNPPNSFLYSFIKDPITGEAFGVGSAPDLRPQEKSAERFSLVMRDISTVGYITDFTMFRMLPFDDADLNLLLGGV